MHEQIPLALAAIIVLGIGAQWLAWRLQLPSILLLLLFGLIIGPLSGFLDPNSLLGDLLLPLVSVSVAVILFEGGLTLNVVDLSHTRRVLLNLISVGVLVTWLVAAAAAYYILGLDPPMALLLGAILTVSGPTVVLPLLRHVRAVGQVSSILRWEGIVVDPIGAMLAVIVFEAITVSQPDASNYAVLITVFKTALVGGALGAASAGIVTYILRHHWAPDFLQNPVTLMLVVATFIGSNLLQTESGLLAVTVMGVVLANQRTVSVKHIIEFKENLGVLLLSSLFILLAARLEPGQVTGFGVNDALFVAVLIFIGRPLAVAVSSFRSPLSWRERIFMSWMAPRGIVAAAVSSVFALQMRDAGYAQAERLVPLTFLVIVATVVIYGLSAAPLSRWLQVSKPEGLGFLIVGAHSWAREIARVLQQEGCAVLLIDTNRGNIAACRLAGIPAAYGSVFSPDITEEVDLGGVGRMLALTSNDEVNSLAAIQFAAMFGRAEVYQLPLERAVNGDREPELHHLRGRFLFAEGLTFRKLAERFVAGAQIRKTPLTEEFSYQDFRARYGQYALPLFLIGDNGRVTVATVGREFVPKPGQKLISLIIPPESGAGENAVRQSASAATNQRAPGKS